VEVGRNLAEDAIDYWAYVRKFAKLSKYFTCIVSNIAFEPKGTFWLLNETKFDKKLT